MHQIKDVANCCIIQFYQKALFQNQYQRLKIGYLRIYEKIYGLIYSCFPQLRMRTTLMNADFIDTKQKPTQHPLTITFFNVFSVLNAQISNLESILHGLFLHAFYKPKVMKEELLI